MPIRINKKQIAFAYPLKDTLIYPFIISKTITNTIINNDHETALVGQIFYRNLNKLSGEVGIQYSVFANTLNLVIVPKLLWDITNQNTILETKGPYSITTTNEPLGVLNIPISISSIKNDSQNNLVGLFIYAYNNNVIQPNINSLDVVYFKKVE